MNHITNESVSELAIKCSAAINNVAFPDLATRKLFEGLIKASSGVNEAIKSLSDK